MARFQNKKSSERGSTLLEFAISATMFLTLMFGIIEFGRLLWTHNALTDATRRGARYAINHSSSDAGAVKNVVVYGNPSGGTEPLVENLDIEKNVVVQYSSYGVGQGTVSVSITNYQFQFVVPIVGTTIQLPNYITTLTGENAGT
ncbi:MAG TPA: TadE family protein [Pyrinomonadaceae bacterium]|jgi:Flp pilus assembly protein TadG